MYNGNFSLMDCFDLKVSQLHITYMFIFIIFFIFTSTIKVKQHVTLQHLYSIMQNYFRYVNLHKPTLTFY